MKLKTVRKLKAQGNALVISLVICSILSLVVGYYLSLVEQQNLLSFRSMAWNSAIAVTEAGIEEGMAQLNSNASLGSAPWYPSGSVYQRDYTFDNGNKYTAIITPNPNDWVHPYAVTAQATVNPNGSGVLAALGLGTSQPNVNRAVRVTVTRGNLLIKGMVARHSIVMNGNGVMTDSYDSTDPAWSTAGQYDSTKTRANGDVAVNDGITNGISGGNANIYGHVTTGPSGTISVGSNGGVGDQAWVAAHPGGIEPGYAANNANFTFPETDLPYTTGLNPSNSITVVLTNYFLATNGTTITSTNVPNPIPLGGVRTNISYATSTILPNPVPAFLTTNCGAALVQSAGFPAAGTYCGTPTSGSSGIGNGVKWTYFPLTGYTWPVYSYTWGLYSTNFTITTNQYDNVLYSGDYVMDTLSGKTLVLGNARLVVKNGINMTGNDELQIAQSGALLMYVDGSSSRIGGNGIVNDAGYPANCQMYFTKNTTDLQIGGNGTIAATVIAPDANVTLNGGGRSNTDFMGALMGSSISLNGHFSFHYDEALSKRGATGRYIVSSWDEIKPSN